MRLDLELAPGTVVSFTEATGPYPYLVSVGAARLVARAGEATGIEAGETASVPVILNNQGRKAAAIIRRPLRAPATIYDDDGAVFFEGTVSSVDYGNVALTLQVDA